VVVHCEFHQNYLRYEKNEKTGKEPLIEMLYPPQTSNRIATMKIISSVKEFQDVVQSAKFELSTMGSDVSIKVKEKEGFRFAYYLEEL